MAYKNSISVYIDGINRTAQTVMTVKNGNFLDERLDECPLSLRGVNREHFPPLTPVEIVVKNTRYLGVKNQVKEKENEKVYRFIVANDSATEMQIGKELYNHELYLIEVTKAAECFVVDTLTFTNNLGRNYASVSAVTPKVYHNSMRMSANVIEDTSNGYSIKSGISAGIIYIPSFGQLNKFRWVDDDNFIPGGTSTSYDQNNRIFVYKASDYRVRTKFDTEDILQPSLHAIAWGSNGDVRGDSLYGLTVALEAGSYIVEYTYLLKEVIILSANDGTIVNRTENIIGSYCCTYYFTVVENKLPLKKLTVTDVINRTLDLAEPLRKGEQSRFRLNPEQSVKFDKIYAPQFSLTKQTLRECLQEIGGFIHGEPRITPVQVPDETYTLYRVEEFKNGEANIGGSGAPYTNGGYYVYLDGGWHDVEVEEHPAGGESWFGLKIPDYPDFSGLIPTYKLVTKENKIWIYDVTYDMWAGQTRSNISALPYIKKSVSQVIDNYASYLDSNAENLVNQLDKYSGVIVEPYDGGAKSVRTENTYVRIDESNMIIATQNAIDTVDKLEYVYTEGNVVKSVDITPWLFEKTVYDTQLSSYAEPYPYSKAYGIYFSHGSKNIAGLNFKVDAAAFEVFQNYAIVNILREATGNPDLFKFKPFSDEAKLQFPKLCFRVTYTPFYNARIAQTKLYYKDFSRPAALIYNQQANVIESRYYGENLKGAIARLGNIEKSLTYLFYDINSIPEAGQMFNRDYYISVVMTEFFPTCIKCTIGLSKDFNRLSKYIGINSERRYSEISQTQAVERNTLYREYIVVGEREAVSPSTLIGNNMLAMIADTFTQNGSYRPITNVCAWGTSYQGTDVANGVAVNLPVISSAFGNSISFSWKYKDNYSAGDTAEFVQNAYNGSSQVSYAYFQNSLPYTDYYGRIYYYSFDLQVQGTRLTAQNLDEVAQGLPAGAKPTQSSGYVSTIGQQPYILRKDNREALQVNFQIDFVTNIDTLIIGSALASYCPAVRGSGNTNDSEHPITARLYVFDTELNKFTDHVESYEDVDLSKMQSAEVTVSLHDGYFTVNAANYPTTESGAGNGKSWAIITSQYKTTEEVENEEGIVSTQIKVHGGDLLIGRNIEVKAGQAFAPVYFTPRREIFSKNVWKDNK